MATKLVSMNTENTKNEVILPQITVQHDITTVMNDVRDGVVADGWEDAWISCYFEGKPSVHGKLRITRISGGLSYEARDGVGWHGTSSADFRVSCASLKIEPTLIRLPKHVYIVAETQRITAFDISPDGTTFATGYGDGSIIVTPVSTTGDTASRRVAKAHLSTVLSLRFFPSSVVLLSSSSDLSLAIHDAKLSPLSATSLPSSLATVRSLKAHSAGVTRCDIIDRGRNVLSFSRDASVRLWNVGDGKEIVGRRWRAPKGSPVLCGCVGEVLKRIENIPSEFTPEPLSGGPSVSLLEGEVGTKGKMIYVGLQDGSVRGYDLSTGTSIFFSTGGQSTSTTVRPSPVDSICYSADKSILAAGSRDGTVRVWDLEALNQRTSVDEVHNQTTFENESDIPPTWCIRRNTGGIEGLFVLSSISQPAEATEVPPPDLRMLLIASADGMLFKAGFLEGIEPMLLEEFIGVESGDGIRGVKAITTDGITSIWSASDDGLVRKY
ncbi:hypothetical protein FRC18_006130 [Serendipita sp. 400]|nr:hypothetical protein FRC18_006130 [Serendipita sp. 400]